MVKCCVFFEVRTGFLNIIYMSLDFKGFKTIRGSLIYYIRIFQGSVNRKHSHSSLVVSCFSLLTVLAYIRLAIGTRVDTSKDVPLCHADAKEERIITATHSRPLDGGEWSASRPGRALPQGKGPPVTIG
jgi:hypothetical protein